MKVILYMAQTVNGIIARKDFTEDFLSNESWEIFVGLAKETGCFIVGKRTYEEVKKWKEYNFEDVTAKKIVVSRDSKFKLEKGYILANSPKDALDKASGLGFSKVLLAGGGTLNGAFMKAGLIDELIINIEPCILGKGIRIFSEEDFEAKLKLIESKKLSSGIVQLKYQVETK